MKRILGLIGVLGFFAGVCSAQGTTFESWAAYVSAAVTPPSSVVYQTGDNSNTWTAPNGSTVKLIVKVPHNSVAAVPLGAYTPGTDARPVFDAALATVKANGASALTIPAATYTFTTNEPGYTAQLVLSGLSNVTIDGAGSTFIFKQGSSTGIYIEKCASVELANITIQYDLGRNMTYVGQVTSSAPYELHALTGNQYPLTSADAHISKMVPYSGTASAPYLLGGIDVKPGTTTYDSATGGIANTAITSAMAGLSYVIFEDSTGGDAIEIKDAPQNGTLQTHDITINNVTINSGPGMGIVALGLARGLTVESSHIVAASPNVVSTEYDGIHIGQAGGDVFLSGNTISQQGDDGINLAFPVQFAYSMNSAGTQVGLANLSRLIQAGDTLSFFDRQNNYLGSTTVSGTPTPVNPCPTTPINLQSPNNYTPCEVVNLTSAVPNFVPANFVAGNLYVRDDNLIGGRMAVVGNTVENCNCHGVLAQVPNTVVQSNHFINTKGNAIRLLSNLGEYYTFQEGAGAINVAVRYNSVDVAGIDADFPGSSSNPYAGISAIGVWANGYLTGAITGGVTTNMMNYYVDISGNAVSHADQDCIMVNSTESVTINSNQCLDDNLTTLGSPSIYLYYSNTGSLSSNTESGSNTGPITFNHAPNFTGQTTY